MPGLGESVPFLPVLRYNESGLRKRADWERTWELQRGEDAIDARTQYETQKVLTGAAISTGIGVAAGMIHPGLGLAARALGGFAVGHQVGEAAHTIHGGSEKGELGAMRAEARNIIKEKANK